jgi:ribonuclease BN (tRNA processing enzyme)
MQVTFLGSGAAFSPTAYNASILIDRTLLLDAGAPLCVHLPKAGVPLDQPAAVFITHFHADHCFNLALLIAGRHELFPNSPPLAVFGPPGTEGWLRELLDLAWGEQFRRAAWEHLALTVGELDEGQEAQVAGYRARAYRMAHVATFPCMGYLLEKDGVRLGYTGDSAPCSGLDALIHDSNHVIAEMTYDQPGRIHLSRQEVKKLMEHHPAVRFILTHRGSDQPLDGAVLARDFLTLELPLPPA